MNVSMIARRLGLLGVLFWGGCDRSSTPTALPRCADGQGLATYSDGYFVCVDIQPPHLSALPPVAGCNTGQALSFGTDPRHLTCLPTRLGAASPQDGAALRQHIDTVAMSLSSLGETLAQVQAMSLIKEPIYVGSTSTSTTGRITTAGKTGLLAAHALCAAQFGAGAHMCTQFQLTRTVAIGKLGAKDHIAPAWIYMPTWHNPGGSTIEPNSGLADNCGGYTTGDDTAGWTGMAVEWSPLPTGDVVFHWHGGEEAPCSATFPIACCAGGS